MLTYECYDIGGSKLTYLATTFWEQYSILTDHFIASITIEV